MTADAQPHPDFPVLMQSWLLALEADGYAANTLTAYRRGVDKLAAWLAEHHPDVGVRDVQRDHVRGWLIHVRESTSSGSARSQFPAVRKFFTWAVDEGEAGHDPTQGIKTPAPNDPVTPVLTVDQVRKLLATCSGQTFVERRDTAIIFLFVDGGLRLAELTGLAVTDVDIRDRLVFVIGKGSNRSGPRRRAVPVGVKAARSLDRYLRERRHHPYVELPQLWLGGRGRATLSADGVDAMLKRRGATAGVQLHPHMFRHTWASQFRAEGGQEGDLMVLGGWRNRTMLDRYGKAAAAERAQEAYRSKSLGDRL